MRVTKLEKGDLVSMIPAHIHPIGSRVSLLETPGEFLQFRRAEPWVYKLPSLGSGHGE